MWLIMTSSQNMLVYVLLGCILASGWEASSCKDLFSTVWGQSILWSHLRRSPCLIFSSFHCPAAHLCHKLTVGGGGPSTTLILFATCLFFLRVSSWISLAHQLPVVLQITLRWMSHFRELFERNNLVQPSWELALVYLLIPELDASLSSEQQKVQKRTFL